jgi:hypothetical protein
MGTLSHLYGGGMDTLLVEQRNELGLLLPLSLGTTYQDYYDSSAGGPGIYTVEEVIKTCDAYGSISFFGNTEPALRITTSTAHRVYQNGSLINSWYQHAYLWFTKSAGLVNVDADTSTILSGNVPIQEIEVTVISGSTGANEGTETINSFTLNQNYPNPFNPSTTISYSLPDKQQISLKVYDIIGNEVASIVDEIQEAGLHSIKFETVKLSTGIYFYQLKAGSYTQTRKMILIK